MLDHKRSSIGREMGNKSVDPNTTFEAGMIGKYTSDGTITICDSSNPAGVLKWNKTTTKSAVSVREAVVLNTTVASTLSHANISNVKVEDVAGVNYVVVTDYTVNAVNGTITRNGSGGIGDGETVYVTYTYVKTSADIDSDELDGKNFSLNLDDTAGSGKIVLIQGLSTVYTDQYDTSVDYAVEDVLYCGNDGKFTNVDAGSGDAFGRVISVPTAADRFLGIEGNFTNDR